eukprot:gene5604-5569_t
MYGLGSPCPVTNRQHPTALWHAGCLPLTVGQVTGSAGTLSMEPKFPAIAKDWNSVASSANGHVVCAVPDDGFPSLSTDGGVSWRVLTAGPRTRYGTVTVSDDGRHIILAGQGTAGAIYVTSDAGLTWQDTSGTSGHNWRSVGSSADGQSLAA